jgi:RimJ/RimL family protein N-acetyltransferase
VKKYDSIIGRAMIANKASIGILEKLGMKFEKEFEAHGGKCKQYRISKEMFLKRKNE